MGFVMAVIWKLDKNTRLFAGTRILLSLSPVCLGYRSQVKEDGITKEEPI